jgi:hypothetical protein
VAEVPDNGTQGDNQPEAQQGASGRARAIVVCLFALAVIGAATANALPNFSRFSLPDFNRLSLSSFNGFSLPNFDRFVAKSSHATVPARIPDPPVSATLKEIQLSQQQNANVLVLLTQSSATQQADLKRISRQLSALSTQVDALQGAMTPLTTSSIPRPKPRARVLLTSRKMPPAPPPLPKPVGPVSVGGAPLSPAPGPDSGSG